MITDDHRKMSFYERRKAARLCVACGAPLPTDYNLYRCPPCGEAMRNQSSKRYYRLLENGICVRCGKNPPMEGRILCEDCRIRAKRTKNCMSYSEKQMEIYNERKAQHKCTTCGVDLPADAKKTRCVKCLRIAEYNVQNLRRRRIEAGVCIECGWRKPRDGKQLCVACSERRKNVKSGA